MYAVIHLSMHHHSIRALLLLVRHNAEPLPPNAGTCMETGRFCMDSRSLTVSCDGRKTLSVHQDKQMMWLERHPARRGFRESEEGGFFL